jgi:hypothetical protein
MCHRTPLFIRHFAGTEAVMNSAHTERREKIKHELREMFELFFYLAFFFGALAIYDILLLRQYDINEYWSIGFALINAAVITKVIIASGELPGQRRCWRPGTPGPSVPVLVFQLFLSWASLRRKSAVRRALFVVASTE